MKENSGQGAAFALEGVSFSYGGTDTLVLNDMNLECREGEWLVVAGRNGSGKSTLLRLLNALLVPERGVCHVFGMDTRNREHTAQIRASSAMVFQNPENQIVGVTVEDDAAFALENQNVPSGEMEKRVTLALGRTGLLGKRASSVNNLSGGEKQRLALAGALAQGARMFLLDEATSMLDPDGREEILSLFSELHKEGRTIVQVTHNTEEIRYADRVIVIADNRVSWSGPREDFYARESLGFCNRDSKGPTALWQGLGQRPSRDSQGTTSLERGTGQRPVIEVRSLSHTYSDGSAEIKALNKVSACFKRGELVSVTGRTGSGKSTLIQYLDALYTVTDPDDGEVLINGQNINISPREARRGIGMVFQYPEHQLFAQTVREELSFALRNWDIPEGEHEERVLEAMGRVGIPESMLERSPFSLSGGEMKAVCIASALVTRPDWLILDEPVAGLDSRRKSELVKLLGELKSAGTGVIAVTHDLEFALLNSDRVIVLREGELICDAEPEAAAEYLYKSRALRLPEGLNIWMEGKCGRRS